MKNKQIIPNFLIIISLTFFIILSYGFIHEIAHWTACEVSGLEGNINIDIVKNPPLYSADCYNINEASNITKFFFWSFPYIISLLTMFLFLKYLTKKKFYLVSLPLGVIIADLLNIVGLYEWAYKIGRPGNDLINIFLKTPRFYIYILFAIIGTTTYLFLRNILEFYKKQKIKKPQK